MTESTEEEVNMSLEEDIGLVKPKAKSKTKSVRKQSRGRGGSSRKPKSKNTGRTHKSETKESKKAGVKDDSGTGRRKIRKPVMKPPRIGKMKGRDPPATVSAVLDHVPHLVPMEQLLARFPHLCSDMSSPAACVGAPATAATAETDTKEGGDEKMHTQSDGKDEKSGNSGPEKEKEKESKAVVAAAVVVVRQKRTARTASTKPKKPVSAAAAAAQEAVATADRVSESLAMHEWMQIRKRLDAFPRIQLVCEAQDRASDLSHPHLITELKEKRGVLAWSLAPHESFLLRASGKWALQVGEREFNFPPCYYRTQCVLNDRSETAGMKYPSIGMAYLFPDELQRFLSGQQEQFPSRPCVACTRFRIEDIVYAVRASVEMVDTKGTVADSVAALEQMRGDPKTTTATSNGSSAVSTAAVAKDGDGDAEIDVEAKETKQQQQQPQHTARYKYRLDDNEIVQPYGNLCEQEGGYYMHCMLTKTDSNWEGIVAPLAMWRRDLIVERKAPTGQPYYDQSAMVWKREAPRAVYPGTSQENF